ncbi:hypothetical protein KI688_004845 [Linnemannia hyalina]|uniref:F-box domain-containing protein n=1 Tax=Linnemannia hyalina TaxID=64524 RepID=A0A9P7XPC4_9FUNG|nr:hypothetical protein KI688_004845 [Linnemannia hyalina]
MPVERVPKKVRLQEHHVAPQALTTTTVTGITAAEQRSTERTTTTATAPITRLGAQSNIFRGHYMGADHKDPLVFFSEEIALHILELLTPSELAQCACVSRQWYRLVNDQMLWRRLFYKDQFIYPRGFRNAGRTAKPALTGQFNTATATATTSQDRRNLKRKRPGPTHHPQQQHYRHRQDEHMVYGDPSSSSTSNSCWKALYRLNHNWIAGQAQVTSLSIQQLSHQDQLFFNPAESSLDRDMEAGEVDGMPARTRSPIVQFQGPVLLIVSPGDMVHLWKIKSAMDVQEPGRDGQSSSPTLPVPSESTRRPEFWQTYRSSRKRTGPSSISCLALDRSSAVGDSLTTASWQKVMVGYDSGHFSIFEYLIHHHHHQDDKPSELSHNKESATTLREIGNTADLPAWSDVGGIQSASFLYPILTTCSDDGTISIYKIQEDHSHTLDHPDEPRHWCRLLHRLYGSSPLSPVEIELRPIVAQQPTTFEQDDSKDRTRLLWRALITFGLQLMDGSWTVRLQEIEFDEQFIWHSIETGVEDESDFERVASYQEDGGGGEENGTYLRSGIPSSSAESFSNTLLDSAGYARIGTISAITISSPYVVTTHPDNTMNVFHMARPSVNKAHKQAAGRGGGGGTIYPKPIRFRHLSTLYGHCGAVSSVAIESRSGRLVSASMDRSIKVWTMVGRNRYDQLEQRRVHQCALSMNDLPQSWTLGARVNKEEGLGLVWVGTDDEKIVSMNSDGTVKVWLFS